MAVPGIDLCVHQCQAFTSPEVGEVYDHGRRGQALLSNSPIFDLELEEDMPSWRVPTSFSPEQFEQVKIRLKALAQPDITEIEICKDVHTCAQVTLHEEGKIDLIVLASRLSSLGYIPVLRTAPGGGHGTDCFRNLHHAFICLHTQAENDGRHIFVDPNFQEQFILQPRIAWYKDLLEIVPDLFVGNQTRIKQIVQLLTKAMALAFTEQGCGTPPWRSSAALLSKWLPKKGIDQQIHTRKQDMELICEGGSCDPGCAKEQPHHLPPKSITDREGTACTTQASCHIPPETFRRRIHNIRPLVTVTDCMLSCGQDANAGTQLNLDLLHQVSL